MSRRTDAFYKSAPKDWQPQAGDKVYTRPDRPGIRHIAYATIEAMLLPDVALIVFHYGGRKYRKQVHINDLRQC